MSALNYRMMRRICLAPIDWFIRYGHQVNTPDGRYFYKDNGSHILGVAHLDSVNQDDHFYKVTIRNETVVYNAHLDDRLGAYVILDLLPSVGITVDWLLTEGEEIGKSTAKHFQTLKKYKWMFQFDRHGDDVVTYKYSDQSIKGMLRKAGFNKQEWGAFTDICELGHLGCRGFNVGTGYADEHSPWAFAHMPTLISQVNKFVSFYNKYKAVPIPFKEQDAAKRYQYSWGSYTPPAKKPGDFAYYDNKEGKSYYYGPDMKPIPFSELQEYAVTTEQQERMDAEADAIEAEASAMFTCTGCHQIVRISDMSDEFVDFCKKCEAEVEECVACHHPVLSVLMDEYHMCKMCHEEAEMGHGRLTTSTCRVCRVRLLNTELIQNRCFTCERAGSHRGLNAPELL